MNKKLTIFTPTYNRKHTLYRIFESFLEQEKSLLSYVEWLIVDDGSSDDTDLLVAKWLEDDQPFAIRYIKKNNGGKHTAFNRAIQEAEGELFFVVDSDDWLAKDSIKNILIRAVSIYNKNDICGIIALKSLPDGKIIGRSYPDGINWGSLYELTSLGFGGERSLVFKTDIIRQYPYPVIHNERFIGECVVYDRLDEKYKYLVCNDVLTVCEYQEDGLTKSFSKIMMHNIIGYKIFYSQRIDMALSVKERFQYAIRYWAFKLMKHDSFYNYKGSHKKFVLMCMPLGLLACIYYKFK